MRQLHEIKVLLNPMDFEIAFAGIVLEQKKFVLVVLGKDNSGLMCEAYNNLNSARIAFFNLFARGKERKPRWYAGKIEYTAKPQEELRIGSNSLFSWYRLYNIFEMSHEKQRNYYRTCSAVPDNLQ